MGESNKALHRRRPSDKRYKIPKFGTRGQAPLESGNWKDNWRKHALWKKYFTGARRRCLDTTPKVSKGSSIFTVCQKASGFFKPLLTWIPGNEKAILIWEESILGEPPLDSLPGTSNLKYFLHT
jgi:hypothetical protein